MISTGFVTNYEDEKTKFHETLKKKNLNFTLTFYTIYA